MTTLEERVTALERSMATKDDLAELERKTVERHAEHERKAVERHMAVMDSFGKLSELGRSSNY